MLIIARSIICNFYPGIVWGSARRTDTSGIYGDIHSGYRGGGGVPLLKRRLSADPVTLCYAFCYVV